MAIESITKESLLDLSHKVVEFALSKGIDAAEIFSHYNSTLQIMTEGRSIANEREKSELGFSVRVIKSEKEGFSYTNKFDFESLKKTVKDAIGIASVAPSNPGIRLPQSSKYKTIDGLYSSSVTNLTIEDLIEHAKQVLEPMGNASVDVRTNLSSVEKQEEWTGIVNSIGVEGFQKANYYQGSFFVVPRKGDKVGSFVFDDFFTHNPKEIDLQGFGDDLTNRAVRNMDAKAPSAIDSNIVVFQKNGVFMPIGIVLAQAVSALNVLQNRSMWKDKLADTVAIDNFNLIDDSHNPVGAGAKSFDDEGNASQKTSIIKDGVLENFLFDELRASKMNAVSTGNSWRTLGGTRFMNPPSNIFPNVPVIQPGNQSYDELLEDVKLGITFEYFSGSFRAENGIFSGVAKGAQMIRDGELAEPLMNVTIGGNVFEMLKNIEGMTKDLELSNGYMLTPKIKASGINISTQK